MLNSFVFLIIALIGMLIAFVGIAFNSNKAMYCGVIVLVVSAVAIIIIQVTKPKEVVMTEQSKQQFLELPEEVKEEILGRAIDSFAEWCCACTNEDGSLDKEETKQRIIEGLSGIAFKE